MWRYWAELGEIYAATCGWSIFASSKSHLISSHNNWLHRIPSMSILVQRIPSSYNRLHFIPSKSISVHRIPSIYNWIHPIPWFFYLSPSSSQCSTALHTSPSHHRFRDWSMFWASRDQIRVWKEEILWQRFETDQILHCTNVSSVDGMRLECIFFSEQKELWVLPIVMAPNNERSLYRLW